jgi:hypothetical protein
MSRPGLRGTCSSPDHALRTSDRQYLCPSIGSDKVLTRVVEPLRVTTASLPLAISGHSYSAHIGAVGGTKPYKCTLKIRSVLPTGITLNRDSCQLSGVAEVLKGGTTKRISAPLTVIVSDSTKPKSSSASIQLTLTTIEVPPAITTQSVVCVVDQPCNQTVATASGGTPPYTFENDTTSGGSLLPLGLFMTTTHSLAGGNSSGVITGTAKTATSASGIEVGVCVKDLTGILQCATANLVVESIGLGVVTLGDGSGTVTSADGEIDCRTTCSAQFATGTPVTLTATPDAGSTFAGWAGACSGSGSCVVTINESLAVIATFDVKVITLSVTTNGAGSGTVASVVGDILCGPTCSAQFAFGTSVALTATPDAGSTFSGWAGACSGTGSCVVKMNESQAVIATFDVEGVTPSKIVLGSAGGCAGGSMTGTFKVVDPGNLSWTVTVGGEYQGQVQVTPRAGSGPGAITITITVPPTTPSMFYFTCNSTYQELDSVIVYVHFSDGAFGAAQALFTIVGVD